VPTNDRGNQAPVTHCLDGLCRGATWERELDMAKAPKIRVGFIGVGGISRGHFTRLKQHKNAEVVALCDIREEAIQRMHEYDPDSQKCAVFSDWKTMIKEVELDGVLILTPHTLHYEMSMGALRAGLHVLCEKPMVCTVAHAKRLMKQIEKSGKVYSISYQKHNSAEYLYIRDCLTKKKYGEVQYITVLQSQDWYRNQTRPGVWRGIPELSGGGQLNDSGSHVLDIIQWCSGLVPKEVFAFIDNLDSKVDILTAASVKFTNGALASIAINGNGIQFYEDLTFYCEDGAFFMRQHKLMEQNRKDGLFEPENRFKGSDPDTGWINLILGKGENMVPAVCGLRVIQLTEAAWESGASGEPVRVKQSRLAK